VLDILKELFKGVAVIEIAILNEVVLIRVVGDLVADYEALKFLITQHDLKRGGLPEIGSQDVALKFSRAGMNLMFGRSGRSVHNSGCRPKLS
jgi:hypothetical protein